MGSTSVWRIIQIFGEKFCFVTGAWGEHKCTPVTIIGRERGTQVHWPHSILVKLANKIQGIRLLGYHPLFIFCLNCISGYFRSFYEHLCETFSEIYCIRVSVFPNAKFNVEKCTFGEFLRKYLFHAGVISLVGSYLKVNCRFNIKMDL